MIWKKLTVAIFAVASIPVAILAGSVVADLVYKRLLFQGYNVTDLIPGDGGGISFLTWISWGVLLLIDFAFWKGIYRKLS